MAFSSAVFGALSVALLLVFTVSAKQYERDLEQLRAQLEREARELDLEDNQGLAARYGREFDDGENLERREGGEFRGRHGLAVRQDAQLADNEGSEQRQQREFEENQDLGQREERELEEDQESAPRQEREFEDSDGQMEARRAREFEYSELMAPRHGRGVFDCKKNSESCSLFPACCGTLQCYWEAGYSVVTSGRCVPCVDRTLKCQRDGQCCQPLVCQKDQLYAVDGVCDLKRPNGAECHKDIQCQAGYCEISWENLARGHGGRCQPIPARRAVRGGGGDEAPGDVQEGKRWWQREHP
jgi:hypothetical protein